VCVCVQLLSPTIKLALCGIRPNIGNTLGFFPTFGILSTRTAQDSS
jgi:hypothetical protein